MTKNDRQRDQEIYKVLFSLAVVYTNDGRTVNFRQTSSRLGYGERSTYSQRIYNFINDIPQKTDPEPLTIDILITRLTAILKSLKEDLRNSKLSADEKQKIIQKLTKLQKKDIICLFGQLTTLSPAERDALNLTIGEANVILQQSLVNLEQYQTPEQRDAILKLYQASISLQQDSSTPDRILIDDTSRRNYINETVMQYFNRLGLENWNGREKTEKIQALCQKIERHIYRVESQIGLREIQRRNLQNIPNLQSFSQAFIKRLINSTIENSFIRESIPLFLEYVTINQLNPLPLYYPTGNHPDDGLLNPELRPLGKDNDNIGLSSQYSYKVTISFNLRIEKYKLEKIAKKLPAEAKVRLVKKGKGGLVFTASSSGVGTPMSQIFEVINRALLWDVKCLRDDYAPIAHDLVMTQDIINNNVASPVWAHSLVRLCRTSYLEDALKQNKSYEECAYIDEVATGDYCGFNYLESVAKSAIQARLSAILQTQINPKQYIQDLSERIQGEEILRIAGSYLDFYPFSVQAMESYIQRHFLQSNYEGDYYYYNPNSYLAITNAYLAEGLYHQAYIYLHKMCHLEINPDDSQITSGTTLAKYELCKANYFYLFDINDIDPNYRWKLPRYDRATFITKCWESLSKAEDHLTKRLKKYIAIKEISQGIFDPYFILLARINFVKAKVFLFFPSYAETLENSETDYDLKNYNYARLCYLERSRIYAAKNGNTVDYACYTAYQVFAYVMIGYYVDREKTLPSGHKIDLTQDNCLKWAKDLLENALINYSEFGLKCYNQIKQQSGTTHNDTYGDYLIENLPLIREENLLRNPNRKFTEGYNSDEKVLHIDMSLLHMRTLDNSEEQLEESIYLFGAKAAIILFARAMVTLCDNFNIEDAKQWSEKILKAYRLFTYAWGVAEDGCITELTQDENSDYSYKITRPHFKDNHENAADYYPNEAKAVRDLYPHRQTEIADLGKVFAIACHLLQLYLTDDFQIQETIIRKINFLRNRFQDMSRTKPEYIEHQPTFNGHLRLYLDKIKRVIDEELELAEQNEFIPNQTGMIKIRQRIMKRFFDFYNLEN
ncbi:MAG: hypothetical protein AB4041_03995 [Microcystaceae cyanobacterium]